jgi:hypothetical protein
MLPSPPSSGDVLNLYHRRLPVLQGIEASHSYSGLDRKSKEEVESVQSEGRRTEWDADWDVEEESDEEDQEAEGMRDEEELEGFAADLEEKEEKRRNGRAEPLNRSLDKSSSTRGRVRK